MQGLKIFTLIIMSITVVISGWVYLAGMGAERTVLSNSYYRDLIAETNLTSVLHKELQEALPDMMLEGMTEDLAEELTDKEKELMRIRLQFVASAITDSFDEAWFEDQFLLVIDDVLALAKGEQQTLTAAINLEGNMKQFQNKLITRLETIPAEIREKLDIPAEQIEQMSEQILAEMDIPDQLYLADLIAENNEGISRNFKDTISYMQTIHGIYQYLPYIVFVLMLLFSCLLAGFAGGLKWFGSAVLFFSTTFLIGIQLVNAQAYPIIFAGMEGEPFFKPELLTAVINYTMARVSIIALISAAAGFIVIISGIIVGKTTQKAQTE